MVKLLHVGDYVARSGQVIPTRLNASLKEHFNKFATAFGVRPDDANFPSARSRNEFYKFLVDFSRENYLDRGSSNLPSSSVRDFIFSKGGTLSDILDYKAAVCRELSMYNHLISTAYGFNTYLVNGLSANGSAHTWLETRGSTVIDAGLNLVVPKSVYGGTSRLNEQIIVKRANS